MIFNVNSGAGKQPVNIVPSTNSVFTYDGSAKTPLWQNFDPDQLTISGADSATNAGTHTVYFTPKADYEWWDGTSTPKEVKWSIAKAAGSLSLSASSATIYGKTTATFTVNRSGDGAISVSSSNTSIATASVSGTTVTVKAVSYGSATITVSVAEGTNHTSPSSKTYTVKVDYLYLYNAGDEYASTTGGWSRTANTGNIEMKLSKGSSYITMSSSWDGNYTSHGACGTAKKVNVTNFDKLNVTYDFTATLSDMAGQPTHYANLYFGLGTTNTGNSSARVKGGTGTNKTASVDISSLKTSLYPVVTLNTYGEDGTINLKIRKVWLS